MRVFTVPALVGIVGLATSSSAFAGTFDLGPITPAEVNSVTSPTITFLDANSVTRLSSSNYVVSWSSYAAPGCCYEIGTDQFRIFNNQGVAVSGIITVNTNSTGVANVAALADGGFAVEFETNNQVWVQMFNTDGSPRTAAEEVSGSGHLGSIASAGSDGVVVTWTNYGPVNAQFFNSNGSQRTGVVTVGSGAWRGNVTQLDANKYLYSWGDVFDGSGNPIGSPISTGPSGNDLIAHSLGSSHLLFNSFQSNTQFSILDTGTDALSTVSLGAAVSNFPDFLYLKGTDEFAAFYELNGVDQTYYQIFDFAGDIIQGQTLFSQIPDAFLPVGNAWFDLLGIQTDPNQFTFAWTDAKGDLWTGVLGTPSPVPEPSSLSLFATMLAMMGLGFVGTRKVAVFRA